MYKNVQYLAQTICDRNGLESLGHFELRGLTWVQVLPNAGRGIYIVFIRRKRLGQYPLIVHNISTYEGR